MRVTAGLSDEDLIDPLGMPAEGQREGKSDAEEGSMMDGARCALRSELNG